MPADLPSTFSPRSAPNSFPPFAAILTARAAARGLARLDPDTDRAVLDEFDAEIDLFVQHSDCFGYEFFVARPRAGEHA